MKKNILLSTIAIILFLGIMSSSILNPERQVVFTFMNEELNLPETPFNYADIKFPEHTISETIQTGYETHADTTILDFVDDDISTLGRVLFYDEKLSAMENMSCATCHKQELSFADDVSFSQGISSLTSRNSMALNDIAWESKSGFFWDMEFDALDEMIEIPFKDENEIGADIDEVKIKLYATDYYADLFEKAFGDDEITEDRIIDALTNFIGSMVTFNSKFDQEADKEFSGFNDDELKGQALFAANCALCHSASFFLPGINHEELITEVPFIFNNGLEANPVDIGAGEWLPGMNGLYKITSLRNIELTGPYMHDGSLETLDDVIDFYSDDVKANEWNIFIPEGGFQFTDNQKDQLKAFLLTLTDDTFITEEKWSNPFTTVNALVEQPIINVQVAPNPMSSSTNITISDNEAGRANIIITDQLGKQVLSDNFTGNTYVFNNYALPSGIYNVSIQTEKGRNTLQLVVR